MVILYYKFIKSHNSQVCRDLLAVITTSRQWVEEAVLDSKDLVLGEDLERKQRKMEEKLNK